MKSSIHNVEILRKGVSVKGIFQNKIFSVVLTENAVQFIGQQPCKGYKASFQQWLLADKQQQILAAHAVGKRFITQSTSNMHDLSCYSRQIA